MVLLQYINHTRPALCQEEHMPPRIHLWCIQTGLIILIFNLILFQSSSLSCCPPTTLPPYPVIKQNQGGGVLGWTSDKERKRDKGCEHRLIKPSFPPTEMRPTSFKNSIRVFLTLKGRRGLMWQKKKSHYYTGAEHQFAAHSELGQWMVIFQHHAEVECHSSFKKTDPCSIWKHCSNIRQICSCI